MPQYKKSLVLKGTTSIFIIFFSLMYTFPVASYTDTPMQLHTNFKIKKMEFKKSVRLKKVVYPSNIFKFDMHSVVTCIQCKIFGLKSTTSNFNSKVYYIHKKKTTT